MSGVSRLTADRNQRILLDLVNKPGNDVCADCKARAPRWASHNLGIFICMNCASVHRKIGTHITKVKSVTMDSWSKEQVEVMKSIGNVVSNAKYNPNEARHPPPANREESERDSELEKFIRWKYEFKRFMNKPGNNAPSSARPPPVRAQSTPAATMARRSSPLPPVPTSPTTSRTSRPLETRPYAPTTAPAPAPPQPHFFTAPPAVSLPPRPPPAPVPAPAPQPAPNPPSHPVWNDIMSLATPGQQPVSSMPSHLQSQAPQGQFQQLSFTSPGGSVTPLGMTSSYPSSTIDHVPSRSASLPGPTGLGAQFQTHTTQQQPTMGNPFAQQPSGFTGQMTMAGAPFQQSAAAPGQIQSSFGQPSNSPFPHSYTPPSTFPQQQQQFAPSSFPQQFVQPSYAPMQQPLQGFPQQAPVQGGNPFGAPMQWQQQPSGYSGQPQYGQWGGM